MLFKNTNCLDFCQNYQHPWWGIIFTATKLVKILWCPFWFCNPLEQVSWFICGRRRMAVTRHPMICLVRVCCWPLLSKQSPSMFWLYLFWMYVSKIFWNILINLWLQSVSNVANTAYYSCTDGSDSEAVKTRSQHSRSRQRVPKLHHLMPGIKVFVGLDVTLISSRVVSWLCS